MSTRISTCRSGLTRIEVVVISVIIVALLCLLLPAIQSPRIHTRRDVCNNNLHNAVTAMLLFEQSNHGFPGYANKIGAGDAEKLGSWVVPLLEMFEHGDLYKHWINTPSDPAELALPVSDPNSGHIARRMHVLICPSSICDEAIPDPLSYIVNAGAFDRTLSTAYEEPAYGVCFDAYSTDSPQRVSLEFVSEHDGAEHTLLVSESNQAGGWASNRLDKKHLPYPTPPPGPLDLSQMKALTTFVWQSTGRPDNAGPPPMATLQSNDQKDASPTGEMRLARPSSNHPGGVMVAFCGGNTRFLAEDIDYKVYTQLMTPDQAGVSTEVIPAGGKYILKDADIP